MSLVRYREGAESLVHCTSDLCVLAWFLFVTVIVVVGSCWAKRDRTLKRSSKKLLYLCIHRRQIITQEKLTTSLDIQEHNCDTFIDGSIVRVSVVATCSMLMLMLIVLMLIVRMSMVATCSMLVLMLIVRVRVVTAGAMLVLVVLV